MKRLLFLFCLSFYTLSFVHGQKTDTTLNSSHQALYDMYMKKSKTNKIVGWTMFGGGLVLAGAGSYMYVMDQIESVYSKSTGQVLFYLGAFTTVASIPVLISAGSNKRKARLALKGKSVSMGNKIPGKSGYTALAFTIQL